MFTLPPETEMDLPEDTEEIVIDAPSWLSAPTLSTPDAKAKSEPEPTTEHKVKPKAISALGHLRPGMLVHYRPRLFNQTLRYQGRIAGTDGVERHHFDYPDKGHKRPEQFTEAAVRQLLKQGKLILPKARHEQPGKGHRG